MLAKLELEKIGRMSIKKIETQLRNSGTAEHIIIILKATFATAPFTGGISSLLSDYIPAQRQLRLEEFAQNVANDLVKFKNEVNEQYILTDEFAFIFERAFKGAMENYQKEKVNAFKSLLVNSLLDFKITQNEKEYYLHMVENLSILHIQILTFMSAPHEYLEQRQIDPSEIAGGFKTFFPIVIPNVTIDIIKLAFQDLFNYGFLTTDSGAFSTMTASSGWDLLGDSVTQSGKRFNKFISNED